MVVMKRVLAFGVIAISGLWAQGGGPGGEPGGPPPGGSGDGIWARNAAYGEIQTFDLCNGHQPGSGQYHHHINPVCLRAQLNDNVVAISTGRLGTRYIEKTSGWTHSPILGWSFDGYPVYGPYGYSSPTDPKSAIRRVRPGFQLRNITQRHTLPDWVLPYLPRVSQNLTATQYGPDVSARFPLGRYVEDYDFVPAQGDLDQYNGRFAVTPEYPNGTYAYYVTIADDGSPLFPYIINLQLYGTVSGGNAQTVATDAADYFSNGARTGTASGDPLLSAWFTKGSQQAAQGITGFDPSLGASTTWPSIKPAGVNVNGGNATPALADIQRVRFNDSTIFVNSNNLPSYTIGPWFASSDAGGVFQNWAAPTNQQFKFPRTPVVAATKSPSSLGPVGIWVNGVSIFNTVDGGSYSNSAGDDQGGGRVAPGATHVSAASQERGPLAAGSLVAAYAEFNASLASSTATAAVTNGNWPVSLGGTTVTVIDSTGAQLPAGIVYASPAQVNYQIPASAAPGLGRVSITAGGVTLTGAVNIAATYPGIFAQGSDGLAAAQIARTLGGQTVVEAVSGAPVNLAAGPAYLILYGSGIGTAAVAATIGGVNATVAYSGAQGTYPGLDQVNVLIPPSLAGKGKASVVVTAAGKQANPVYVTIQ